MINENGTVPPACYRVPIHQLCRFILCNCGLERFKTVSHL